MASSTNGEIGGLETSSRTPFCGADANSADSGDGGSGSSGGSDGGCSNSIVLIVMVFN